MPGAGHPGSRKAGVALFLEASMRLVMIDNYDSFTYNLVQLFYEFGIEVRVFRNDEITVEEIRRLDPAWICISPGPKDPAHAGISKAVIERLGPEVPVLGVCLGMQAINEVFAGKTREAPFPVHGKTCLVHHGGESIFHGLPSPFRAARYHSLCIEIRSDLVVPLALAPEGVHMGIRHRFRPIFGVQFHPESFMTEYGIELARNFLNVRQDWRAAPEAPGAADRFPRAHFRPHQFRRAG
ncbi:MAG: aminodeoxychorismate/anthranilate synthase component II [Syntrophobacteraceae bacterium]